MKYQDGKVELEMTGRCGELKYYESNRYASAYVEMSGVPEYHLLVWSDDFGKWSDGNSINKKEHEKILTAFKRWAEETNFKCQW